MYDKEMADLIARFTDKAREKYGNDSYMAGYFSAWVRQFGENDPKVRAEIVRQLKHTVENI